MEFFKKEYEEIMARHGGIKFSEINIELELLGYSDSSTYMLRYRRDYYFGELAKQRLIKALCKAVKKNYKKRSKSPPKNFTSEIERLERTYENEMATSDLAKHIKKQPTLADIEKYFCDLYFDELNSIDIKCFQVMKIFYYLNDRGQELFNAKIKEMSSNMEEITIKKPYEFIQVLSNIRKLAESDIEAMERKFNKLRNKKYEKSYLIKFDKNDVKKNEGFYIFRNQNFFYLFNNLLYDTMYYFKVIACSDRDVLKVIELVESLYKNEFLNEDMIYLSHHEERRKTAFEEVRTIIS